MTLSALLLQYAIPLLIIVPAGIGTMAWSAHYRGIQAWALVWGGIVFWIMGFLYVIWGIVIELRIISGNEDFNKAFPKPEPIKPIEQYSSEVDAITWTIGGMDARIIEKVARAVMNGTAFTSRSMTGKDKPLTPREYDYIKPELISRGYLIKGKGKTRGRWSREGLEFLRDVRYGKIMRLQATTPPPPKLKIPEMYG
jgi:hypothetical protein